MKPMSMLSRTAARNPRARASVAELGTTLAVAALLISAGSAWSQATAKPPAPDALAGYRTGQWVRVEGMTRGGASAACTGLRRLAGDFLDDDWAMRGPVQSVQAENGEFVIAGCRVQVTEKTTYENPSRDFRSIQDLRPGMVVDVEGTFVQDRGLVAAEVDDESDEVANRPDRKERIEIVGRIQNVDTKRRVVTVMGIEFQITDTTKLRSAIK